MSSLKFLKDKKILILGLGATGVSCARFLASRGYSFSVNDSRTLANEKPILAINPEAKIVKGCWDADLINQSDVIIASPGVDINLPAIQENRKADSILIGDVELFSQLNKAKVLAVTGSNGKSTVVTLLHHMAQYCGVQAVLAGNIGTPVLDIIDKQPEYVIIELSSFQLETMRSMNAVAATVLNVSDDHLDRHHTLANYQAIKHRIYNQTQYAVFNRQQCNTQPQNSDLPTISYGLDEPKDGQFGIRTVNGERFLAFGEQNLLACSELPLVGAHNDLNCLAALAMGYIAQWPMTKMLQSLISFEGLEHRCKLISTDDGINWVNDSKATNIGATVAAIDGLANHNKQLILIAGGDGKGANFSELANTLNNHVSTLICLGKDGPKIAELKENSIVVDDLPSAVEKARELAQKGDIVLLSPACASLDMFENYMQRGEHFINAVMEGI